MRALQWCPSGHPLAGRPGEVLRFLSEGGKHFGYGYGPGWSMIFGSAQGDIKVEPGQWIVKHRGRIEVVDHKPAKGGAIRNPATGSYTVRTRIRASQ